MVRERRMWSVVEGNVERRRMWSVAGRRALEMGIRKGCEAQQRPGREGEHDDSRLRRTKSTPAADEALRGTPCYYPLEAW